VGESVGKVGGVAGRGSGCRVERRITRGSRLRFRGPVRWSGRLEGLDALSEIKVCLPQFPVHQKSLLERSSGVRIGSVKLAGMGFEQEGTLGRVETYN